MQRNGLYVLQIIKWNLNRLVHSGFTATAGSMMQSLQAGEKTGADQLRIHLYVFGILNRLKVNLSDGLQMRKGYVSLFSPLKLTDADLQSVCVQPWVKKKFSCKWRTQLLCHGVNGQTDKTLDPFVNATDIDHVEISSRVCKTSRLSHHFN